MGKKILVVEDRISQRRFIQDVLLLEGYEVIGVENYELAKTALLNDNTVQLLILDQMVPGMTGTDFLSRVRREEIFQTVKDIPAILLTAYPEDKDVRAVLSNGVQVLSKPLRDYQDLINTVKEVLARGKDGKG
jgi:CheY-like chemotaxis protein